MGRSGVVVGVLMLINVALVAAAMISPIFGVLGVLAVIGLLVVLSLGSERTALLLVAAAFFTAPAYRGLKYHLHSPVTPTHAFLLLAMVLIVPTLLERRLRLPSYYLFALVCVFSFGAIGSLLGPATGSSLFHLLEWVMFIGVLPVLLAWCFADRRTVRMLAWSYLAGQVLSTLDAFVSHPVGGRYEGLSHHPNAFALAGMMSFALVLFLFHEYTDDRTRWILIGIAGLAVVAVVMSGSRASAVVVAGLVLLIPFVERSALASLGLAAVGAVGLALLPVVAHVGGSGSALSRLTGDDTTTVSDQMRSDAFSTGVARFLDAPIFGSGLSDVELTHNVYLEVAIGTGIFGFAAYLVLLGVLAMPLFGSHPLRRLSYLTWAIVGSAAALPGLWDPTMWVCAGLVSMVLLPAETFAEPRNGDAVEPTSTVLVHS